MMKQTLTSTPQFKTLLFVATKETIFLFNKNLYQQTDGVSIASIGPSFNYFSLFSQNNLAFKFLKLFQTRSLQQIRR